MSTAPVENGLRQDKLAISGMRCAACAQIIEYRLRQMPGVQNVQIFTGSARAEIAWQPRQTSLQQIIDAIVTLGYRALPLATHGDGGQESAQDKAQDKEQKKAWWRLFVAGFAMMQVMMYAFPAWLEPHPSVDGDLTPDLDMLLKLASLALSIPVLLFSSSPFFQGAWRDIKNRHIGMDVPITIGILGTFAASVWATFQGGPVYYDSLIMFVFLLLGARLIEHKMQQKSQAALRELTNLLPLQAQRLPDFPTLPETETVLAASLQVDDVVLIAPGAQVPVDGVVLQGSSQCDEALMTGEARAVLKKVGDAVIAGALNLSGSLIVRAGSVGDSTQLSLLVGMMERAANQKPALVQLADRHASRFLLAILLLALGSGIAWWWIDPARALPIALTVLVITCPCALSLATPAVMAAVVGRLAQRGVLVARGRAVESLAQASHFVFDKTGTLTSGKLHCTALSFPADPDQAGFAFSDDDEPQLARAKALDVVQMAAQLASHSLHPASVAVARLAVQPAHDWQQIEEIAGEGIAAQLEGQSFRLGKLAFVEGLQNPVRPIPADVGAASLVAFGNASGVLALFSLQDKVRDDAAALLQVLQQQGKSIVMLSGDRSAVVQQLAHSLALPAASALGDLTPQQKYEYVQQLQQQGARVAMIGDGMNDGPVLSLADVSVAMGQGAPITQARSDLVLISNRLSDLQEAVLASQFALRLIRENLIWALAYNLLAIPAAVAGWLQPWHAALGMSASSVLVVANSLRMLKKA